MLYDTDDRRLLHKTRTKQPSTLRERHRDVDGIDLSIVRIVDRADQVISLG